MAPALINQPVIASNPQANCNSYIVGLLDELRQRIDALPVVPGATVPVDSGQIVELRGAFTQTSIAIRNHLKWSA